MSGLASSRWRRTALEAIFWVVVIGLFWTLDTLTKLDVQVRAGFETDTFRLVTEQVTSGVGVLVMVLFVAFWLRQFPLDRPRPVPTAVGHVVGTVLFAVGHYAIFVLLRKAVFGLRGMEYMPDQRHLTNLLFEYKKDIKIYLVMVAIIAAYRYWQSRGAAQLSMAGGAADGNTPQRLVVRTPKGERLVELDTIEYFEAARNYVLIHTGEKRYMVRSSLKALLERLPAGRFVRTHRSFLANVDSVRELRNEAAGPRLVLRSGTEVPVSQRYRDEVRGLLQSLAS